MNAFDLLTMPITYDIIISDFGRDATIEYLRLVASLEKKLIGLILKPENLEFYDEYRRIMFSVIGDLNYFKETMIEENIVKRKCLTDEILIGVGRTANLNNEFVDRVAFSVIQEIISAIDRNHLNIRILIPCNTLSSLTKTIEGIITSEEKLIRINKLNSNKLIGIERISSAKIIIKTVPDSVMNYLSVNKNPYKKMNLLVLGTSETNLIYNALSVLYPINIIPLTLRDQELINNAIVASIGGNSKLVKQCTKTLEMEIIEPIKNKFSNLIILEACTDFHLGLGLNSLEVFASETVTDLYRF